MEDDRLGVGVVEEVVDLVGAVAEVRVDRHERALERGDHGLEVLGPVVQVARHLRLVPEAGRDEVGGQRVGAPLELAPRDDPVAVDLARPVRDGGGVGFVDVGEVPVGHWCDRSRSTATVRDRDGAVRTVGP